MADRGRTEGSNDLAPLSKLTDWQVAEGDPDIRGWDAIDNNGNKIGKVDDLIINRRTGEASYAVVAYGGSLGIGEKHTLIPVDDLKLDKDRKLVVSSYPADAMQSAPDYKEDTSNYSAFDSFWAGVAAAAARGRAPQEREQPRGNVVQRFVQRMEPGREREQGREPEIQAAEKRKVRVHMAHRTPSGDEVPLHEGDVLEIPVVGGKEGGRATAVVEEIVIRLEAVEEEDQETHRYRM